MISETYDCQSALTDEQVVEFCRNGFLILEGVVPEQINRRTFGFVDKNPSLEPLEILDEDWFVEAVIKNPQAVGVVRSLLGKNFKLPEQLANHRVECPRAVISN